MGVPDHLASLGAYHVHIAMPLRLGVTSPGRLLNLTVDGSTQPNGIPIVVIPESTQAEGVDTFPAARHSWVDGTVGGHVTLRGLSFVGFGGGDDDDGNLHAALLARLPREDGDSLTLERCTVDSNARNGIVVDSGAGTLTLVATAVTESLGGHGVLGKGDFRGTIEVRDSVVSGCTGNGVLVEGTASRLTVANSTVGGTGGIGAIRSAAIATMISASYIGVTRDGTALPNLHGIYLDSAAVNSAITETVVGMSDEHGIWTNAASTTITGCLVGIGRDGGHIPNGGNGVRSAVPHTAIIGTVIGNSGGHAVNADGTHTRTIDSFLGVSRAGVHIPNGGAGIRHGSSSAMNVIRNSVIGNARGAAGIDASASDTTIEDSFFGVTPGGLAIGNAGDGIHCDLSATNCNIRNNTVGHSGGHGIHSSGFPTVIAGCRVRDSVGNGIDIGQPAAGTVVNTSISGNNSGAGLHSAAPRTVLVGSHIGTTPAGDIIPNHHGIHLGSTAADSEIIETVVGNNAEVGIWSNAPGTAIVGSLVGVNEADAGIPNAYGIRLRSRATGTRVIGTTVGASTADGVWSAAAQTTMSGCFVGLTSTGVPIGNAGDGILLVDSATDSNIADSTVGWSGGTGIATAAVNTSVVGNVVGLFLPGDTSPSQAPIAAPNGANGVQIFTGGDCSQVANNTIGHSGNSGVQSWSAGVLIEDNVIGTVTRQPFFTAGYNATNRAHGISAEVYPSSAACGRASAIRSNMIRYSQQRAIRVFDQSDAAVVEDTEHSTNGWGLGACDLCTCEPTRGGVLVRCESPANLGPNFPTSFPAGTVALVMRNTNLTVVDVDALRGMAYSLVELDLSFNSGLDLFGLAPAGEQLFDTNFSRLEVINLDGISLAGLRPDAFSSVGGQLRLLRLSAASQPPPVTATGIDFSSAGAALAALPWYSAASCPVGYVHPCTIHTSQILEHEHS